MPVDRHPKYLASLTDVIPFLDSADQSNTTVCLIASSLKANVNIWKVSAPILPIWNNNLIYMHCSLKSVIFWRNKKKKKKKKKTALGTKQGHTSQQRMPQLWNRQQTTTKVLLLRHTDGFCTNYSSRDGQGVTGGSLTLQWKDPSADQYGSLPMVVEKCPSEQILWDIFLGTETFVFYNEFLLISIQYTTNNFPNTTWVEFNS